MLDEQAMQMSSADAHQLRELFNRAVIQRALADQAQRAADHSRRTQPRGRAWRGLRPAATARPKSRRGGCRGGGVVDHVLTPRRR